MVEAFGADRPAAVCRELTKTHEEVVRGPLAELAAWAEASAPRARSSSWSAARRSGPPPSQTLVPQVLARADAGERLKDAVAAVAEATGVAKRELYEAALAARKG